MVVTCPVSAQQAKSQQEATSQEQLAQYPEAGMNAQATASMSGQELAAARATEAETGWRRRPIWRSLIRTRRRRCILGQSRLRRGARWQVHRRPCMGHAGVDHRMIDVQVSCSTSSVGRRITLDRCVI